MGDERHPMERPNAEELIKLLRGLPRHERIVTLRGIFNMSQADLAEQMGMARGTVSTWEAEPDSGRCHSPSRMLRIRLGMIFGVPPEVFTDKWGAQPKMPYWKNGQPKPAAYEERERREAERPKQVTPVPAGVRRI